MTCGHSPLPPSRYRSFGRGARRRNVAHCSPTTSPSAIPSLAEPHPMTCGHSPLPPSRERSFGRGARRRNDAYCSPTTNPSAPLAQRAQRVPGRGVAARAAGVRSLSVSSASSLVNLRAPRWGRGDCYRNVGTVCPPRARRDLTGNCRLRVYS